MNWRITPSPPDRADRAGLRRQVAGDDPQQGGLAGAVGPDQRGLGALADPEAHVVEQHPAVGELVPDGLHVEITHGCQSAVRRNLDSADNAATYESAMAPPLARWTNSPPSCPPTGWSPIRC